MSRIRPVPATADVPVIDVQSTLPTAPDLCKNVSLTVLFGSSGNSYTLSSQSDMCACVYIYTHTHTHTYSSHYRDAGGAEEIDRIGTAVSATCQGTLPACHSGYTRHRLVALVKSIRGYFLPISVENIKGSCLHLILLARQKLNISHVLNNTH